MAIPSSRSEQFLCIACDSVSNKEHFLVSINNNLRSNSAKWRMLNEVTTYHANGDINTTTSSYVHRTTTNQEMLLIANTVADYTQKLFDTEDLMTSKAKTGNTNPLLWKLCYDEVFGI